MIMPKLNLTKGFTLVEMLVAITILMIGVVGPLTLAARGIADGLYIQNELAGKYLAQEGIELVVAQRLGNLLSGEGWLNCLVPPSGSDCSAVAALTAGPETITLNNVPFVRTLSLVQNGDELLAGVTVSWSNKTVPRSYTLTERFYRLPQ